MKEFKDKVAVITGAASGIGYDLAERCAREGMRVVLADIEEDTLIQAEKNIKALGVATLAIKTDVSRADDVKALAEKTVDTFGAVHLLFNNAGVNAMIGFVSECTLADWKWTLDVNLWGVIHGVHFFVPIMVKQDTECHIVNTSSASGLLSSSWIAPYSVSKHGIVILSEALYQEFRRRDRKIGISVLCPGTIKTKILEAERNRPVELKNKSGEGVDITNPEVQAIIKHFAESTEDGMEPRKVADIVFNAIKEKSFYILANINQEKSVIQARMEDILQERNPTIGW